MARKDKLASLRNCCKRYIQLSFSFHPILSKKLLVGMHLCNGSEVKEFVTLVQ